MQKKITLPKLLKQTQEIVNKSVRDRDGCCLWCKAKGITTTKSLQAHHYILAQGSSSLQRFNMKNMITLCYGHHIHGIHKNPTLENMKMIEKIAIKNNIATPEEIEEIMSTRGKIKKWSRGELIDIQEFHKKNIKK